MRKLITAIGVAAYFMAWPLLFIFLRSTHRSRVIVVAENQILLTMDWLGNRTWTIPGGGRRRHELASNAAVREVKEETGLDLNPKSLRQVLFNYPVSQIGLSFYVDCFVCQLPKLLEPHANRWEILKVGWFPIDQLDNHFRLGSSSKLLLKIWLKQEHLLD